MCRSLLLICVICFVLLTSPVQAAGEWESLASPPKKESGALKTPEYGIRSDTLDPDNPPKRKPYIPPRRPSSEKQPASSLRVVAVSAPTDRMPDPFAWKSYLQKMAGFPTTNESLKSLLGSLMGVDVILEACSPKEVFERLEKSGAGKPISILYILGHGSSKTPHISLCGSQELLPEDVDVKGMQKKIREYLAEVKTNETRYCAVKTKASKITDEDRHEMSRLDDRNYALGGELAKLRDRLKLLAGLGDVMAENGVIQLLNCSGAASARHIEFVKNIGRVLMWKKGGVVWASTTDINVGQVSPGGLISDGANRKFSELYAQIQTGRHVKPGDFYMVGDWQEFPISPESSPPVDSALLKQLEDIENYKMPTCPKSGSAVGVFPNEPFNGMQITYSFSGGSCKKPTDKPGFTTRRSYEGILGSGPMTLSGTVKQDWGYGATVRVRLWAGNQEQKFDAKFKKGESRSFDLNLQIPENAKSGGFLVDMTGEYNAGGRGLVVSGNLER